MAARGQLLPWLAKNNLIIRGIREKKEVDDNGDSVNSHHCLNGGVWRVPMSMNSEFLEIYADDCEKGVVYSVSENATRVYKAIFDLDFHGTGRESKSRIAEYTAVIVDTVKRFYPDSAKTSLFKYIVCKAKDKKTKGEWKQGRHVIFPFLTITKEYGQTMVASIRAALEAKFGARGEGFNSWKDVVDAGIHITPHLRMVFSDKPEKCKQCAKVISDMKTKPSTTDSVCGDSTCERQKIMTNRPYVPQMVMNGDGSADTTMLSKLVSNMPLCVRMTSIRTPFSSPTSGFHFFPGATSLGEDEVKIVTDGSGKSIRVPGTGKLPKSGAHNFAFGQDATGNNQFRKKKNYLDARDARCEILVRAARTVSSHYGNLLFLNAFYMLYKRSPTKYILNVKGEGSQYCLNSRDNHRSASIYFIVSPAGIRQACFCKCDKVRVSGITCAQYQSPLYPLDASTIKILFPDMANEFTFQGICGLSTKRKVKELKKESTVVKKPKTGVTQEEMDIFRATMAV